MILEKIPLKINDLHTYGTKNYELLVKKERREGGRDKEEERERRREKDKYF